MSFSLIPYHVDYDTRIHQLEKLVVQGSQVKLQLVKNHFLDRSTVFRKYFACLAIDEAENIIGTSIGAEAKLMINGELCAAGFGYDVKVHPSYRNHGVGREMSSYIYQHFCRPGEYEINFITLKASNVPVLKLVARAIRDTWTYSFVYLTIPTSVRIKGDVLAGGGESRFSAGLFNKEEVPATYYTEFTSGLGCFYTHLLYRLRIEKISTLYKKGLKVLRLLSPQRYAALPKEHEVMDCATLYNHTPSNICNINDVLEHLQAINIKYLLVCCKKRDSLYHFLRKYAINTYGYYLLADSPMRESDEVCMDVRCL